MMIWFLKIIHQEINS